MKKCIEEHNVKLTPKEISAINRVDKKLEEQGFKIADIVKKQEEQQRKKSTKKLTP